MGWSQFLKGFCASDLDPTKCLHTISHVVIRRDRRRHCRHRRQAKDDSHPAHPYEQPTPPFDQRHLAASGGVKRRVVGAKRGLLRWLVTCILSALVRFPPIELRDGHPYQNCHTFGQTGGEGRSHDVPCSKLPPYAGPPPIQCPEVSAQTALG